MCVLFLKCVVRQNCKFPIFFYSFPDSAIYCLEAGTWCCFQVFGCTLSGPTWNLLFLLFELGPGVVPNFFAVRSLDLLETCFLSPWHLDLVSLSTFGCSLPEHLLQPGNLDLDLQIIHLLFPSKLFPDPILTPPIAFLDYRTGGANLRSKRKGLIYGAVRPRYSSGVFHPKRACNILEGSLKMPPKKPPPTPEEKEKARE